MRYRLSPPYRSHRRPSRPAIHMSPSLAGVLRDEAARQAPLEICGLLAGVEQRVYSHYPLVNIADDPTQAFTVDRAEQVQALTAMEAKGEKWVGIYHSHPSAAAYPSQRDIDNAVHAGLFHVIISVPYEHVRAFRIDAVSRRFREVKIRIL